MTEIRGFAMTTEQALFMLSRGGVNTLSAPDDDEPGDPQSAGDVMAQMYVNTISANQQITPDAVRAVVTGMSLDTPDGQDTAARVLACRPSVAEAAEWTTTPPSEDEAAFIAALRS